MIIIAIGIYVEYKGQVTQIPVNPEELKIKHSADNEIAHSISLGEITQMSFPKLSNVNFQSFFPRDTNRSYVIGKTAQAPDAYVSMFRKIMDGKEPCRLIISDVGINFLATIESFEHSRKAGIHEDVYYQIEFKEYKMLKARFVKIEKKVTEDKTETASQSQQEQEPSTNKEVTIGCKVLVNGQLHRDSYGEGPGQTESNATRLVNYINMEGSHPYHVTTLDGGWRGWVTASSVQVL